MSGFYQAEPFVLEHSPDPIPELEYQEWLRVGRQPIKPLANMTEDERGAILYGQRWVAAKCDKLSWPLSFVHFDHAVDAGAEQAIKTLQQVIGAKPTGKWDAETQERYLLECHDKHALFERLLWGRQEYYYVLAFMHPKAYGPRMVEWTRRVLRLRRKALELW